VTPCYFWHVLLPWVKITHTGQVHPKKALVEFRVLGSVELWVDGQRYDLGPAKERCVLAVLLMTPGRPVPAEKLVDCVWGANALPTARDNLYSYVSRLRRRIERLGGGASITSSRSGGYTVDVDAEAIDVHRFRLLQKQARAIADSGDDERALDLLSEAAQLWRGEPLANLVGDWAERTRKALENEFLTATLERIQIELRLARHADLVGELSELVARNPFHEKLVEHLIVALYRCGQQAEALRVYYEASHRLRDELGTSVTPDLQEMHQRILRGDRTLLPVPRAHSTHVDPHSNLPLDLRFFIGRESEIADLLASVSSARPTGEAHDPPVRVIGVDGMPGIGKTVFAVHLAHRLAGHYPDAQLYLDLHAYDADQPALDPNTALDMLLRLLGVPARRIPATLDDRTALWRTELAHRRLLVLLDNAAGHDQIRPLLPGAPGCLAIVTSRRRLAGLDDVRSRSLDVLSAMDAASLFAVAVGPGRPMGGDDVASVVRLCGHLPMAIQLAGNRLRHRPAWSVADLAGRLAQDNRRLAEIRAENREITMAFELSYRGLTDQQQQAFRRLGLHLGYDFTRHAAAAAIGGGAAAADRMLDDLHDHHLLVEPAHGRFGLHDLIRDYARQRAEREDTEADRRQTIERILDHYLSTADRADRLLFPYERRDDLRLSRASPDPVPIDTTAQAREWLRAEQENLLATANHSPAYGRSEYVGLLAHVLAQHLDTDGHWEKAAALHEAAATVWREHGDRPRLARALADLSLVRFRVGQYADALEQAAEALTMCRSSGDRRGEAEILDHTGLICWAQSRFADALSYCRKALEIRRSLGDRRGEAQSLDHVAILLDYTGRYREAADLRERALTIYADLKDSGGQQIAMNNMGNLQLRLGRVGAALDFYEKAAEAQSEMSRQHEAIWLNNMADIYRHTLRHDDALNGYRTALRTYEAIGDRRSEIETIIGIGATFELMGQYGEALIHHQKGLAIARDIRERYLESRALLSIGDVLLSSGRHTLALEHFRQSLQLADDLGTPYEKAKSLVGIGGALLHTKGRGEAKRRWKQALRIFERLGVPEARSVRSDLKKLGDATDS
jgi:DNA-binding SARP family transcriptional activator/tetratricopeptide (TPR) repeat protein